MDAVNGYRDVWHIKITKSKDGYGVSIEDVFGFPLNTDRNVFGKGSDFQEAYKNARRQLIIKPCLEPIREL